LHQITIECRPNSAGGQRYDQRPHCLAMHLDANGDAGQPGLNFLNRCGVPAFSNRMQIPKEMLQLTGAQPF